MSRVDVVINLKRDLLSIYQMDKKFFNPDLTLEDVILLASSYEDGIFSISCVISNVLLTILGTSKYKQVNASIIERAVSAFDTNIKVIEEFTKNYEGKGKAFPKVKRICNVVMFLKGYVGDHGAFEITTKKFSFKTGFTIMNAKNSPSVLKLALELMDILRKANV